MFALNIAEDGRVLSATFAEHAQGGMIEVDALPEGDVSDYLYVDGAYVYDPLELPDEPTVPTLEARVQTLEEDQADIVEALEMILTGVTE